MCDFSLMHAKSRPAKVGDKLVTKSFGMGTIGFADVKDQDTAVCLLPGTEIAFDESALKRGIVDKVLGRTRFGKVAIFRQINKDRLLMHHDALEYPGGALELLTNHSQGKTAVVLQLPAAPKSAKEAEEQKRLDVVG